MITREQAGYTLPKEYEGWSGTQIGRYITKLTEWGLIKKIQKDTYKFIWDAIEDFTKSPKS